MARLVGAGMLAVAFLAMSGAVRAQAPFPMKYLGDLGHLDTDFDKRTSVDLGVAKVFADGEDLRFEGHDASGKLWQAWLPEAGGVGFSDVWTADFDRNGRRDLLIATYSASNGRCTDRGEIYTLMFDDHGRPVPWIATSNSFGDSGRRPVSVIKNVEGRAEIVTVNCEPDPARFDENRRISGIYEAKDARWIPMRGAPERPYLAAAKRHLGPQSPGFVQWIKTDPTRWPDFLDGYNSLPTTQMRALISAEVGCGGIRIQIVNGRVATPKEDPCEVLRNDRVLYSDGKERNGWPAVMIDSSDGRKAYLSDSGPILRKILTAGYRLRVLGNAESPGLLWVDAGAGAKPVPVSCRVRTGQSKQIKLTVQDRPPTGPDMMDDTILGLGQRCFWFRSRGAPPPTVAELQNCPAIERLRNAGVSGGIITVRESATVWQIVPDKNLLRGLRLQDGGEFMRIQFQPAPGANGNIVAAVEFRFDWLVEWRSGTKHWLVLHSAKGEPLTTAMAKPVDGDLFDSQNYDGLHFLKWENGKPAELIIVPASIEWSRAVN